MESGELFDVARQGIWIVIKLGGPVMAVGLVIGLTIALFQSLTQIQEMTLSFVPKILSVFGALYVLIPWMGITLSEFMYEIADLVATLN